MTVLEFFGLKQFVMRNVEAFDGRHAMAAVVSIVVLKLVDIALELVPNSPDIPVTRMLPGHRLGHGRRSGAQANDCDERGGKDRSVGKAWQGSLPKESNVGKTAFKNLRPCFTIRERKAEVQRR
ncbi:MAG: hypothetical protein ABSB70_12410 [Candidatus Velthaea sp.]